MWGRVGNKELWLGSHCAKNSPTRADCINQLGSCKALLYTNFACSLFLNICLRRYSSAIFSTHKKRKLKKNLQIKDEFWE